MLRDDPDRPPLVEPLAGLERELIDAYLAGAHTNVQALLARNDDSARKLLIAASLYATSKLTEIESRQHYLRKLHGDE